MTMLSYLDDLHRVGTAPPCRTARRIVSTIKSPILDHPPGEQLVLGHGERFLRIARALELHG